MTTKAELKKQIEELQAQYDAMPDEPQPLFEVADVRDRYWFVDELLQVSPITYSNDSYDREQIKLGNHFNDKTEAQRMAAFIRKNFLYWRMALRFADGYEIKHGSYSGYVYDDFGIFRHGFTSGYQELGVISMSKENAQRFAEFCNEHKKELGL